MKKNDRNIAHERNWFLVYYPGSRLLSLVTITFGYYLGVKFFFGDNFYILQLLSAMTGALWGFRFQILYNELIEKWKSWFSTYDEYYNFLHRFDRKNSIPSVILLVELFIIFVINP